MKHEHVGCSAEQKGRSVSPSSKSPKRKASFVGSLCFMLLFFLPFYKISGERMAKQATPNQEEEEGYNPMDMINHHIKDHHAWDLFPGAVLYLPVVLYSADRGLEIFSSRRLLQADTPYQGYTYDHGHVLATDSHRTFYDFSITKNVLFLFLEAACLLLLLLDVGRRYRRRPRGVPKGFQSALEPLVLFVRDQIVRPCINGPHHARYLPYLLTLFFFILFGNLMGLLPGAANLTGNIAVTGALALITFFLTNLSGNKHYWQHIFNMPGIPVFIRPLMAFVEFISLFTKPFSLMVRLFVAVTAGHIVILSLLSLPFIFQSFGVGLLASLVTLFVTLIEILVSLIQAYVFTMFTSLYIGMATERPHPA